VDVLVAVRTGPVADRHPGGGLHAVGLETDGFHRLVGDLSPLVVAEVTVSGGKGQRQVEDVAALGVRAEGLMSLIEAGTEVCDLAMGHATGQRLTAQHEP